MKATGRNRQSAGTGGRRGIVLLEVLAAAAIAAFALLVIIGVLDRCQARETASSRLAAAARAAEALIGEAELEPDLAPGAQEGACGDVEGATYRRDVELWLDDSTMQLFQVRVEVLTGSGADSPAFELIKWVYRNREKAAAR